MIFFISTMSDLRWKLEPHTGTFKFLESMTTVKDKPMQFLASSISATTIGTNQNRVTKNFLNTQLGQLQQCPN
jgi:hypothetical protein